MFLANKSFFPFAYFYTLQILENVANSLQAFYLLLTQLLDVSGAVALRMRACDSLH
jgi:hypothetical protein